MTPKKDFVAFDTETHYTSTYSVKMGIDAYVNDPRFQCYLVSFWGEKPEDKFVGHPSECPWSNFKDRIWLSHNSRFDRAVLRRLIEVGLAPEDIFPDEWRDTAALAAYLQAPRNLEGAASTLLDEAVDKSTRERMIGLGSEGDLPLDLTPEVLEYAIRDAEMAWKIWDRHGHRWPDHEKLLAQLTVEQGENGIFLDSKKINAGIEQLTLIKDRLERLIPWARAASPVSPLAFKSECKKAGIPPPKSTDRTKPECQQWQQLYGERAPWLSYIWDYRAANRIQRLLETMAAWRRQDGTMPFSFKYFGAPATGRWSGDAGLNLQNLNRNPVEGVDPRSCLKARPDYKLLIADLSQIELRVIASAAGDTEQLERIKDGVSVYQAHAEATMGFKGEDLKAEDPDMYLLAKARTIGLSYGAGGLTFKNMARNFGLELSAEEAQSTVSNYRRTNPKIVGFWRRLETEMEEKIGSDYFMDLPSGRYIRYFGVLKGIDGLLASTIRGERKLKFFGAKLAENFTQAVARDVFAEGLLRIHKAGIQILFHAHDEVICETRKDSGITVDDIIELLAQPPEWMPGLPLAAEGTETTSYLK